MAEKKAEKDPEKAAEAGNKQVAELIADETENGFRGAEVDGTPNENYTVEGVTSNPEGVPEAAEDPVLARREAANVRLV